MLGFIWVRSTAMRIGRHPAPRQRRGTIWQVRIACGYLLIEMTYKIARAMSERRGEMPTLTRRRFVSGTAAASVVVAGGLPPLPSAHAAGPELSAALPEGVRSSAVLDALPGKKPLIKLSYRPPNYETPIEYFRQPITPNNAFFVRYHLAFIPNVDATTWKISVGGDGVQGLSRGRTRGLSDGAVTG